MIPAHVVVGKNIKNAVADDVLKTRGKSNGPGVGPRQLVEVIEDIL